MIAVLHPRLGKQQLFVASLSALQWGFDLVCSPSYFDLHQSTGLTCKNECNERCVLLTIVTCTTCLVLACAASCFDE